MISAMEAPKKWEVSAVDVQWTDALYPLAQEAMRRGYYMPNRNSIPIFVPRKDSLTKLSLTTPVLRHY